MTFDVILQLFTRDFVSHNPHSKSLFQVRDHMSNRNLREPVPVFAPQELDPDQPPFQPRKIREWAFRC